MNAQALSLGDLFARAGLSKLLPADATLRGHLLTGLCADSRRVVPGDVFVALAGRVTDGRFFIGDAVARGASLVLTDRAPDDAARNAAGDVPIHAVDELARYLGVLASAWYAEPSHALRVLGVTGTNGKTSCTHHLAEMLEALGEHAGICGTLGNGFPGRLRDTGLTTADPITLARSLAWMRDAGAGWVAMEVSSHALDQDRIVGTRLIGALLTNLSRDHLDYHGTMEAYGEAKRQLFLAPGIEVGVLNRDDDFARALPDRLPSAVELLDYSLTDRDASLHVVDRRFDGAVTEVSIDSIWGQGRLRTHLLGEFLLSNLLGCVTLLVGLGHALEDVLAVADVAPVPGRLQALAQADGSTAVVDYAHTPDALARALSVLRGQFEGRVICVFGCGGERDAGKRPEMGAAAEAVADVVIVTDDNPRGEDGDAIVADILAGMTDPDGVRVERDRAAAIAHALELAEASDVVLIAGKGHETYQEGPGGRRPFSDVEVIRALGRARSTYEGADVAGA